MSRKHRSRSHSVYLLRHGDCRQDGVKRYLGQADLPLNDLGRNQARAWQRELAGIPLQRIFSSDLSRSFETASIIGEGRECRVQPLVKLREIHLGAWDGLPMAEVRRHYPEEFRKRGADMVSYRIPGGECFADVAARAIPLFEEIVRGVEGNLLIVGHSGVNMVLLSHVLGLPLGHLFRMRQDYGGLNLIDCGPQGMRLLGMNLGSLGDHHRQAQAEAGRPPLE